MSYSPHVRSVTGFAILLNNQILCVTSRTIWFSVKVNKCELSFTESDDGLIWQQNTRVTNTTTSYIFRGAKNFTFCPHI